VRRVRCRSALQRSRLVIAEALARAALSIVERGPYFPLYRRHLRRLIATASSLSLLVGAARLMLAIYVAAQPADTVISGIRCVLNAAIALAAAALLLIAAIGLILWQVDHRSDALVRRATDTFLRVVERDGRIQRLLRHAMADTLLDWLAEEYPRWAFPRLARRCTELAKSAMTIVEGGERCPNDSPRRADA